MTEHRYYWRLQYHLANMGVLCLVLSEDTHISFSHLLWQAASCVRVSNVRTALLFNQSSDYPFQHFVDENDAAYLIGIGYSGRISERWMSPRSPATGLASLAYYKKKKHNWAAPPCLLAPREDGPWWGEALPCVFCCCTTKSMIRKRRSVTRNAAVSAGRQIGTPATVFNMIIHSQMNSEVIHFIGNVWHETHTQEPQQCSVITWSSSSQPLVTHRW